jgi:hypothetical protein
VNIYELQRLMGHRHITTTERYLHYAPDPNLAARLTGPWDADEGTEKVVAFRKAGWPLGEPLGAVTVRLRKIQVLAAERNRHMQAFVQRRRPESNRCRRLCSASNSGHLSYCQAFSVL